VTTRTAVAAPAADDAAARRRVLAALAADLRALVARLTPYPRR
jgi:hypothetical protein